jgi:hypothetical protein
MVCNNIMKPGFCKKQGERVIFAENSVLSKDYELYKENKDTYTYPVDGWIWFENIEDSFAFFDVVKPVYKKPDPKPIR